MATRVVTDSTCDLPTVALLDAGVAAVPLRVRIGDDERLDGRELRPGELYRLLRDGSPSPRTRPPDPDDFAAVYRALLRSADEVVSIHLSSRLSETLTHAQEGAKRAGAGARVRFVDARSAGSAMAEQVLAAARAAAAGRGAQEVAAAAERVRDASVVVIAPESLHWLRAGGRIGRARALLGGMLSLRPLLGLHDGEIDGVATVRASQRIERMVRHVERRLDGGAVRVAVGVADDDLRAADALLARLETSTLRVREGRVQRIGAALASHLGPGTLTLTAYPESALVAAPPTVGADAA
jgi:DegV family protein with EDD domain